ncbi:hypothetical protein [Streptomyces jumonjinensis]|uniref:Uncharacterized protein n=1 Tax=Streptomyces jumonjinensis TaxID=1945 RepID=A0A646KT87_STRJU|nr:hypothetical protein [Streptomyces jumonjinensis]MQT05453.1 hypothetical protein [Streptomyces jumonjinensis]
MQFSRGVQILSEQLGLDPQFVARAVPIAEQMKPEVRAAHFGHLADWQVTQLSERNHDLYTVVVANLAMRLAGRRDDALLLMDIYKASTGTAAHRPLIRPGVGARPWNHDHRRVQDAVRILTAAGLPPIHTDGQQVHKPGFEVLPDCPDLPGWIFINPDPEAEQRTGFAGGRNGYLAVMHWAGWPILTDPMPHGLWAVCHPDHRNNPFPPS